MENIHFEKLAEEKIAKYLIWLRANIETVGTIIAVFVVLVVIVYFSISRRQMGIARASEKFSSAQGLYSQGMKEQSTALLNEVISQYPSSVPASHARLLLAEINISDGKYDDAYNVARHVYEKGKPKTLRPFGLYMSVIALEQKNDGPSARASAMLFIEKYPDHFLTPRLYEKLAELYELEGMNEEARQTYSRLANLYPASAWAQKAAARLQHLSTKTGDKTK